MDFAEGFGVLQWRRTTHTVVFFTDKEPVMSELSAKFGYSTVYFLHPTNISGIAAFANTLSETDFIIYCDEVYAKQAFDFALTTHFKCRGFIFDVATPSCNSYFTGDNSAVLCNLLSKKCANSQNILLVGDEDYLRARVSKVSPLVIPHFIYFMESTSHHVREGIQSFIKTCYEDDINQGCSLSQEEGK
jgi:hypothetical protein